MIDRKTFKRKLLLRAVSSKVSLIPFVGGLTMLFVPWVLGITSAPLVLLSLTAIIVGGGIAMTRIILQTEAIAKEVMDEAEREAKAERERRLDALYEELRTDGDPRTEALLQDLRVLMKSFQEDRGWTEKSGGIRDSLDILSKVDQLAEGCIKALEQSLQHYRRGSQLRSAEVRRAFDKRREAMIEEVQASIVRLGEMHAKIQELGIGTDDQSTALSHLRAELDHNLNIAEKVERRMRGFMDDEGAEYEKHATN